jgi:phosphonate degradation associated HDIG domain protein
MNLSLSEICSLLERRGHQQYGTEAISQLDHALQCAHLAERSRENTHTVVACLLHDFGHLLATERAPIVQQNSKSYAKDDLHQYIALPFLRALFPPAVLEPIRLHVDAKRYLCNIEAKYWAALSPASKHSLELQGGIFDDNQAKAFFAKPFAKEAVTVRRFDDLAKVKGKVVPSLSHYLRHLQQVCLQLQVHAYE